MTRATTVRIVSIALILTAALVSLLFTYVVGGSGNDSKSSLPLPGISLGLTAEAQGLLAPGAAFPSTQAGQSSYVTGAPVTTSGKLSQTVDSLLTNNPGSRLSDFFINNMGDNFALVIVRVPNVAGLISTEPHVYIDTGGRVVAFFRNDQNASALMQWNVVADLESGTFQPTGIDTTVLLDALQATLETAGLSGAALDAKMATVKHYNFEYPQATGLLLVANTKGSAGEEVATFAVPAAWTIYEVAWSYYHYRSASNGSPYTGMYLDGTRFAHPYYWTVTNGQASVGAFIARAAHSYKINRERARRRGTTPTA